MIQVKGRQIVMKLNLVMTYFSNKLACAIAEFSHAVDDIRCKPFELIFSLSCSSFNNLSTAPPNCFESPKSKIIPASSFRTSFACGMGVEIMGSLNLKRKKMFRLQPGSGLLR